MTSSVWLCDSLHFIHICLIVPYMVRGNPSLRNLTVFFFVTSDIGMRKDLYRSENTACIYSSSAHLFLMSDVVSHVDHCESCLSPSDRIGKSRMETASIFFFFGDLSFPPASCISYLPIIRSLVSPTGTQVFAAEALDT